MGISITKRPDKTTTLSGKTARWLAVNGEYPVVFEFLRQDYKAIIFQRTSSGKLAADIPLNDLTSEIQVGDYVYFHSVLYDKGTGEVKSVALTGQGATRITVDFLLEGTWTNDFNANNYINLLSSRQDYRVEIKVIDSITRAENAAEYRPYNDGRVEFDVSSFVRLPLAIDNDYTTDNKAREDISKKFYLEFTEKWGATENLTTDTVNYYAVSGAMQLQETHAPNLLSFTAFGQFDLPETEKGKFLTDFENPTYWSGYPFNLHYIVENNDAFPSFQRIEEGFNDLGGSEGVQGVTLSNPDYNYLNAITLDGNYSEDVCELDVWIDSGLVPANSCEAISANDWKYDDFKLDGSYISGVFMSPNTPASIIASIDSYPNGELYQNGVFVSALIYSASRGYYEIAVGNDQVLLQGTIEAKVLNVPVTTTAGDNCTPDYIQTVAAKDELNDLPVASNVTLDAAAFGVGDDVSVSYAYSDIDGDLENVAGTEVKIYRFDNQTDCQNFTNGTLIFTELGESLPLDLPANLGGQGGSYTIASTDAGKWIKARVTPAALTGASPGLPAYSACQEIEAPAIASYTHNKQTSHELTIFVSTGQTATIKWGDATEQAVTGSAVAQTFSKTYGSAGTYTVQIFGDAEHILELHAANQGVLTLDISNTTHITNLTANGNAGLTSVAMPVSQVASMTNLNLNNCDITGAFSCTNIPFTNASIQLQVNANLTSWDLTGCTGTFTLLRGDNCDLTGTFTIPSGLNLNASSNNNQMYFMTNQNLTGFDISNLTGRLYILQIYSSNITGVLDFGSVEFVNGLIRADGNSLLTGWDISTCTGDLSQWQFNNCALAGTQVIDRPFDGTLTNNFIYTYNCTANTYSLDLSGSSGNIYRIRFQSSNYVGTFTDPGFTWTGLGMFTGSDLTTNGLTSVDLSAAAAGSTMNFFDLGSNSNLVGSLDLTSFDWAGTAYFRIDGTGITSVDHTGTSTTSGSAIKEYDASNANLTGAVVLGAFEFKSASSLLIRNNPLLTSLDTSNLSGRIRYLYIDRCDITGTVDLTGVNLHLTLAEVLAFENTLFTGFLFDTGTTGNLITFQAYKTAIIVHTNDFGNITIDPACNFEFFDCALSAFEVDTWWNLLDTMDPGSGASGSLEGGGTNAAPTATSDTARTNLTNAGYTVIT